MPVINVVDSRKAIQYTGSNSAEIDAAMSDFIIDSEGGGVLNATSNSAPYVINTNDWVVFWQGYVQQVFSPGAFALFLTENVVGADLSAIDSRLDSVETAVASVGGAAVRAAGVASAPTLLLGVPANVAVQIVPAMPDASYTASAYIFGTGVNLGQVTINSVTVTDADTVTVQVQTSLVSLPGVHVLVVAKD